MATYEVVERLVTRSTYIVEADSEREADELVLNGDDRIDNVEYVVLERSLESLIKA